MTTELQQIKDSYETLGMTPEEIAEDRELDLVAVKAALMQASSKYRKDCGKEEDKEAALNFTDEDLSRVNQVILDIALGSDDDNLRLKAATYIRDDKKGRKEVTKQMGGMQFNILNFNQQIQAAREAMRKALPSNGEAINV